jgi:polar amino acid transport system ATP-binding protein
MAESGFGESQHYGSQGLQPTGPATPREPSAPPSPEELGPLLPGEPRRPIAHTQLGAEMLRIEGVRKSFGDLEVLKGIDLTVAEHEVVALIGASGSGKSTLLRCINLIEPIDEGSIVVSGQEITDPRVSADRVRRGIGIVYQSFNLFPHMTVLANVTLAPRKVLKLSRAEAESRATELLTRFGLAAKKDVHPDRLSGGQQQRVAIVRALAMRPDLLLLDEITSALDPVLVSEVLDVVRELAVQGMTMVIATHEMGFARDVANRVCFLHQGTILEQGPATEILGNPARPETQAFLERVIRAGRL